MKKMVNIGIVAHVDAGKTTITEQLLYQSGTRRSIGRVDDGTAQTDFLEVERARGISVRSAVVTIETDKATLNLIDTPGHVDFAAEVERSLAVLDTAILVISAVEGIQAQTEILYDALTKTGTNVIFFINKIDRVGSRTDEIIAEIREKFTKNVVLMSRVSNEGEKECTSQPLGILDESVIEALAEHDEGLMEKYLESEPIDEAFVKDVFLRLIKSGEIAPILCGSGMYGVGTKELLSFCEDFAFPIKNRGDDELSGIVYKVTHDKTMGRIAHVRMFGGQIKSRDMIKLPDGTEEKVTQIRKYDGAKFTDIGCVKKGDVAALCGLSGAKVSDVLGVLDAQEGYALSVPLLLVKVIPEKPEELYAVMEAFDELCAEDPQLFMAYNQDEQELTIRVTGVIQLEILTVMVKQRYNLNVTFGAPTVIYKETPKKPANGYEAYTMPKPCWAVVSLDIEPLARGAGIKYESVVKGNLIPYRYQNHIETSVPRALKQGMYNWEVTDLSVKLVGGGYHHIHTHPLDFFLATPIAVMRALEAAGTDLLEPIITMRISAPEDCAGKIIGDMTAMRGVYDSPVFSKGSLMLEAQVPVAESLEYAVRLASLTGGKGVMSTRFYGYEKCPPGHGCAKKRIGVNPLDRAKWILTWRNAMREPD